MRLKDQQSLILNLCCIWFSQFLLLLNALIWRHTHLPGKFKWHAVDSSFHNISQIQPTRYRNFDLQLFESEGENPEEAGCMFTEKKNLHIWGPVQFKSVVFKGQLYSLCCTIGGLSIHWLWYPQGSQNPPGILREDCNCITFTYLSNTKITWLSKCGPQANSSTTWNVLEVQILRPHWRLPSHRLWDGYAAVCFPGGSDGKESAWNAGDPGSIPGLGRSPREGNSYPL